MFKMSNLTLMLMALAAPLASASDCGSWRRNLDIQGGGLMKTVPSPDTLWCKKECMKVDGCVAAAYESTGSRQGNCALYRASPDAIIGDGDKSVFVFCPKCNTLERGIKYEGGEEIMTFSIKDVWWCRKKCIHTENCNAFNWRGHGRMCTMLNLRPGGFTRETVSGYHAYTLCDKFDLLPKCGGKSAPLCYEGEQCEGSLAPSSDGTCECGGEWENCCLGEFATPDACEVGLTCDDTRGEHGQCAPCGGAPGDDYQVCCPGDICNSDDDIRRKCVDGQCRPCGGQWNDVCDEGPKCDGMMMPDPHSGTQCVMMGADK